MVLGSHKGAAVHALHRRIHHVGGGGYGGTVTDDWECINCHGDEVGGITGKVLVIWSLVCVIVVCWCYCTLDPDSFLGSYTEWWATKLRESTDKHINGDRPADRLKKIVMTKYKIWVGFLQVVTVIPIFYPIDFGKLYLEFFDDIWTTFNLCFNVMNVLPFVCWFNGVNFYHKYVIRIFNPILVVATLCIIHKFSSKKTKLTIMWVIIIYMFTIYPFISSEVMTLFNQRHFENGECYLKADYAVSCSSSYYLAFRLVGFAGIFTYIIGIPVAFFMLLYPNREELEAGGNSSELELSDAMIYCQPLAEDYKPSCWWYEVFECLRKVVITCLSVMWYPEKSTKIVIAIQLSVLFVVVFARFKPFRRDSDNNLMEMSLYFILLIFLYGLCVRLGGQIQRTGRGTEWEWDLSWSVASNEENGRQEKRTGRTENTQVWFQYACVWLIWIFSLTVCISTIVDIKFELDRLTDADDNPANSPDSEKIFDSKPKRSVVEI